MHRGADRKQPIDGVHRLAAESDSTQMQAHARRKGWSQYTAERISRNDANLARHAPDNEVLTSRTFVATHRRKIAARRGRFVKQALRLREVEFQI